MQAGELACISISSQLAFPTLKSLGMSMQFLSFLIQYSIASVLCCPTSLFQPPLTLYYLARTCLFSTFQIFNQYILERLKTCYSQSGPASLVKLCSISLPRISVTTSTYEKAKPLCHNRQTCEGYPRKFELICLNFSYLSCCKSVQFIFPTSRAPYVTASPLTTSSNVFKDFQAVQCKY